KTWSGMLQRCFNKANASYIEYGGRGITVKWRSFKGFLKDMGPRLKGHSIHRVDNDGDYSKSNCIWALPDVQANNKVRKRLFNGNEVRYPAPPKQHKVRRNEVDSTPAEVVDIDWFGDGEF